MINELIKLATHLDKKGFHKEANYLDAVLRKVAYYGGSSLNRNKVFLDWNKKSDWSKMKAMAIDGPKYYLHSDRNQYKFWGDGSYEGAGEGVEDHEAQNGAIFHPSWRY